MYGQFPQPWFYDAAAMMFPGRMRGRGGDGANPMNRFFRGRGRGGFSGRRGRPASTTTTAITPGLGPSRGPGRGTATGQERDQDQDLDPVRRDEGVEVEVRVHDQSPGHDQGPGLDLDLDLDPGHEDAPSQDPDRDPGALVQNQPGGPDRTREISSNPRARPSSASTARLKLHAPNHGLYRLKGNQEANRGHCLNLQDNEAARGRKILMMWIKI
ncbi:Protein of unknown function [Cotesia congregata]|uniref:Uncharacterized protein n=1 Tax=Cotesia congregata TaxID=51543 RepID=A0A8J2HIA5_COTCN|nr:Protein of unknown function [Cotesia congregata]